MAIQTANDPGSGQATVTFSISGTDADAVSVVGSFNDWTPGLHTLEQTPDGTLAVTVLVEPEHDLHFRYLDSNGSWFDDPEADAITEYGSLIFAARLPADGPETGTSSRSEPNEASPTPVGAASASHASSAGPAKTRRATKQTA